MEFNRVKCKTMHFGFKNQEIRYKFGDINLDIAIEEKDLGVG